jgi:hypothetical protein
VELPSKGEQIADVPVCTLGSDNVLCELTSVSELTDEVQFLFAQRRLKDGYRYALKYRTDFAEGEEERLTSAIRDCEDAADWAASRIRARLLAMGAKSKTLGTLKVALLPETAYRCQHGFDPRECSKECCPVVLVKCDPYVHVAAVRAKANVD